MSLRTVHTGVMYYDNAVSKIPAAAIAVEDAEFIQRAYSQGTRVRVRLTMACETLDDAPSRNVIAEIVGREKPHEIIVIGGHIDSWVRTRALLRKVSKNSLSSLTSMLWCVTR